MSLQAAVSNRKLAVDRPCATGDRESQQESCERVSACRTAHNHVFFALCVAPRDDAQRPSLPQRPSQESLLNGSINSSNVRPDACCIDIALSSASSRTRHGSSRSSAGAACGARGRWWRPSAPLEISLIIARDWPRPCTGVRRGVRALTRTGALRSGARRELVLARRARARERTLPLRNDLNAGETDYDRGPHTRAHSSTKRSGAIFSLSRTSTLLSVSASRALLAHRCEPAASVPPAAEAWQRAESSRSEGISAWVHRAA